MNPVTSLGLPEEQLIGRRAKPRTACNVVVEIKKGASDWQQALLADISATGFRLTRLTCEPAGTSLWLRLPRMEPLPAKIRWSRSDALGCEFLYPLDKDTEARIKQLVAQGPLRIGPGCGQSPFGRASTKNLMSSACAMQGGDRRT